MSTSDAYRSGILPDPGIGVAWELIVAMTWSVLLPIIPALLSAGAAVYAALAASRARASELEAVRLRELEQRLSVKKMEAYEEILTALGNMLTPEALRPPVVARKGQQAQDPLGVAVAAFMNQAIIYCSDEVLVSFSRFRMASGHNPPAPVLMRLVADFMLAIRRDLDGGQSKVTGIELLGMRINDLFTQPTLLAALKDPFDDVCDREGWVPPWDD